MAYKGFIELLRLADLANARRSGRQGSADYNWRGVVFEVSGQRLVAPLGEVAEILSVPDYTSMPLVKPWLLGIANVRGRLLPLTDLAKFLDIRSSVLETTRKVLVIDHHTIFSGLIIDKVLGIEQFTKDQYRSESLPSDSAFAPYSHGKFCKNEEDWFVFMPSLLAQDKRYIDAAL